MAFQDSQAHFKNFAVCQTLQTCIADMHWDQIQTSISFNSEWKVLLSIHNVYITAGFNTFRKYPTNEYRNLKKLILKIPIKRK